MTCSPYVENFEAFEQCTLKKKYDFVFTIILINCHGNTIQEIPKTLAI